MLTPEPMLDLIQWLRGVLDDQERIATEATGWQQSEAPDWRHNGHGRVGTGGGGYYLVTESLPRWAEHMARHNPAAVLADIAAKRAILDLHAPFTHPYDGLVCDYCNNLCHSRSGLMCDSPDAPYPCDTVRLLASAYRHHPGFLPEWEPVRSEP